MITKSYVYRGHVRAIEDVVDRWKADYDEAMEVRDIEELVRACLWLGEFLTSWQKETWELAFAEKIKKPRYEGNLLRNAYASGRKAIDAVRECIQWAEQHGYEVENSSRFEAMAKSFNELEQDFNRRWPFADETRLQKARRRIENGDEGQPLEDVIREVQGSNPG